MVGKEFPVYHRACAWLKLVGHWSALRGDDLTWINAGSLKWDKKHGLQGVLRRSKTTGPGKRNVSRPVTVGAGAWLVDPGWLLMGLELWQENDAARENFFLLPMPDGSGFRKEGVEPADRAALSRMLMEKYGLWGDGGQEVPGTPSNSRASKFWTEHSARTTVVTMARSIGVPKEITDRIGFWTSETTTADEYIPCGRSQITEAQAKVARMIRDGEK